MSSTPPSSPAANPSTLSGTLGPEDFDLLDDLLDAMREKDDETPEWEFCEGFMAALVCSRRQIAPAEYWPVLFEHFNEAEQMEFIWFWRRRWAELETALDADVKSLDDPRCYQPAVLDMRGAIAALPEEERAQMEAERRAAAPEGESGDLGEVPSFGQIWALGFMYAVENWPEDWAAPRDKETAQWLDQALTAVVALTEDDKASPAVSMYSEDGPPTVSDARLDAWGEAIWAVYDLRQLWKSLGPRVESVRKDAAPGRNDLCPCGSGKKFKKCHGG